MPLAPKHLAQIKQELNLEATTENLGPALRRACGFAPQQDAWPERLELIAAIVAELAETKPEELTKLNKEGKNALHYALDCLFKDVKSATSFAEINNLDFHLQIIQIICSYYPSANLVIDHYLSQLMSREYSSDDDFYYQGIIFGFGKMPVSDVTVMAIKFITSTMHEGKSIFDQPIPIILPVIRPIVIASAHIDTGIQQFFDDFLSTLTDKGYKLVCLELPTKFTPKQYLDIDSKVNFFKELRFEADQEQQRQIEISQSVIAAAEKGLAHVEFIDCTPASSVQESMFIAYLRSKTEIISLVNDMREQAMVRQTILSAIERDTNPIMLIGTNHHAAVKDLFEDMGIDARYLLVTSGAPEIKALYPRGIKQGIQVVDFSLQPKRSEVLRALGINAPLPGIRS